MSRTVSFLRSLVRFPTAQKAVRAKTENASRERTAIRFTEAQRLIETGHPKEALKILLDSLRKDPTHTNTLELAIDLVHRHGDRRRIVAMVSTITKLEEIASDRQREIIDVVVPYCSYEDSLSFASLLTEEQAKRIYEKINRLRISKIEDFAPDSFEVRLGEPEEWLRASLASSRWDVALEVLSRSKQTDLPIDSLRRALRRLNNASDTSVEFESLVDVFLEHKPGDGWAQSLNDAIYDRRDKHRELEWRNSLDAAGFPFYQKRNGIKIAPEPNRILYVLHNSLPFDSGGYALRTKGIVEALKYHGWDPVCVTRPGYGAEGEATPVAYAEDDQSYLRLPKAAGVSPEVSLFGYIEDYAQKLFDLARLTRPEILHAASNHWTGAASAQVAQALRIPFVYEVRGLWELTRASMNPGYSNSTEFRQARQLEVSVAQRADVVVTLTEQLKDLLVSEGVKKHKIFVVPNGVNLSRFKIEKHESDGPPIFGYVGSLVKYEGLDLLIRASEILHRKGITHEVHIIGDGAERRSLEMLAKTLGIQNQVTFFGRVSPTEAANFYDRISVAVYPRLDAPVCQTVSPLKPFEAFASGTAVLASDVAPLRDIVEDGVTGSLHIAGSVESLANGMQVLATDKYQRRRLGLNGTRRARSQFQWQHRVEGLIEAYEHAILKNNGRRNV